MDVDGEVWIRRGSWELVEAIRWCVMIRGMSPDASLPEYGWTKKIRACFRFPRACGGFNSHCPMQLGWPMANYSLCYGTCVLIDTYLQSPTWSIMPSRQTHTAFLNAAYVRPLNSPLIEDPCQSPPNGSRGIAGGHTQIQATSRIKLREARLGR